MARRLTLVVPSLGRGGAQRVMAWMANHWARNDNAVTLITLESSEHDVFPLDGNVRRVPLGVTGDSRHPLHALWNNAVRIRRLRRAIRDSRPDHVVSFVDQTNALTILACARLTLDVVVAERTDPRHHPMGRMWSALRRWTYPRCRAIVVQTSAVRDVVRRWAPRVPVYVIPNAVTPNAAAAATTRADRDTGRTKRMVAMGRLGTEKGFDLLIEAFVSLAGAHPDWTLEILGEGPARGELENLIRAGGMNERIVLRGWIDRPEDILPTFDLFVLSSRYEGFPNALLEAMSSGLPVVSFDCESGPAEVIRDGYDGLLVPAGNVTALAEALSRLMQDAAKRKRLGEHAREVAARFDASRFFQCWEAVLLGVPLESLSRDGGPGDPVRDDRGN